MANVTYNYPITYEEAGVTYEQVTISTGPVYKAEYPSGGNVFVPSLGTGQMPPKAAKSKKQKSVDLKEVAAQVKEKSALSMEDSLAIILLMM